MKDIDKFYIIEREVKKYRNLQNFTTKNRKRESVQLRQEAMYFTKLFTSFSLSRIGGLIANKNHATVLYSDRVVKNIMSVDKSYEDEITFVESIIKENIEKLNNGIIGNKKTSAINFIFNHFSSTDNMEIHIKKDNLTYILHL